MLKGFHSYFYFCHIKSNHSSLLPFCPKRQKFDFIFNNYWVSILRNSVIGQTNHLILVLFCLKNENIPSFSNQEKLNLFEQNWLNSNGKIG